MRARGGLGIVGWALSLALLVSAASAAKVARAQRPSADSFRPSPTSAGILTLPGATTPGHLRGSAGAFLDYSWRPLRAPDQRLIEHRLTTHLGGQLGLGRRGLIALDMPFVLGQAGGIVNETDSRVSGGAVGDLALEGRVRLVGALPASPVATPLGFGLTAALGGTAPTGASRSYAGEGQFTLHADLHAEFIFAPGLTAAASLGYLLRPYDRSVGATRLDDVVRYALGAKMPLPSAPKIGIRLETRGELGRHGPGSHLFTLDAGVSATIGRDWSLLGAVGTGLGQGYGAARLRGVIGLIWEPRARDADGDGVADEDDECPHLAEDLDGFEDDDGCDDVDNDQDFVLDSEDRCPNDAAEMDADDDMDGCTDAEVQR